MRKKQYQFLSRIEQNAQPTQDKLNCEIATSIMNSMIRWHYKTHLLTAVFSELDPPDHLLVDQVGPNRVVSWVVPGREDLLAKEKPPGRVPLLGTHFLGVLLALGNGVHHMVSAATQR